ncbi:urotensin 1 [Heptranchias perlo]|uniref:urotensin 1 n=1 Tax=Heptranchias perlo TaxID=212740 RepID=UPI00355A4372
MTPTPLIFLAACLLLVTRIPPAVCRAVDLSIFDRRGFNVNTATDEENDHSLSYILREKLFQSLGQNPKYMMIHPQLPPAHLQIVKEISAKEASRLLRELSFNAESPLSAQEVDQDMVGAVEERAKRPADPPNSLDLTFHILREMIEIAKNENQWMQAHNNRKIMDTVGK